jgi:hypothetical protein
MDDAALRAALGPVPATPLADGVQATMTLFAALNKKGSLDTKDLDQ